MRRSSLRAWALSIMNGHPHPPSRRAPPGRGVSFAAGEVDEEMARRKLLAEEDEDSEEDGGWSGFYDMTRFFSADEIKEEKKSAPRAKQPVLQAQDTVGSIGDDSDDDGGWGGFYDKPRIFNEYTKKPSLRGKKSAFAIPRRSWVDRLPERVLDAV